jgi:hypothetical protein
VTRDEDLEATIVAKFVVMNRTGFVGGLIP